MSQQDPPATPTTPEALAELIRSTLHRVGQLTYDTACCLPPETIDPWGEAYILGPYQMYERTPGPPLRITRMLDQWALGLTIGGQKYRVIVERLPPAEGPDVVVPHAPRPTLDV